MITIRAHGWHQFLTAFGILRAAGVEPLAAGGNQMRVPDDTDRGVLRAVAATGAAVAADLTETQPMPAAAAEEVEASPPEPPDNAEHEAHIAVPETKPQVGAPPETDAPAPKRTPRKTTTRRKTKE